MKNKVKATAPPPTVAAGRPGEASIPSPTHSSDIASNGSSHSSVPAAAAVPTMHNVVLLLGLVLGLTFMALVFIGIMVASHSIEPVLATKITATVVFIVSTVVLSFFASKKKGNRGLHRFVRAVLAFADSDGTHS